MILEEVGPDSQTRDYTWGGPILGPVLPSRGPVEGLTGDLRLVFCCGRAAETYLPS